MTIPADCIAFEGDTAWIVFEDHGERGKRWWDSRRYATNFDRPCDTCGGPGVDWYDRMLCEGCDDCPNGRHVFDIEVDRWALGNRHGPKAITMRVSIVPGMVLPIVRGVCPDPTNASRRRAHVHLAEPCDDEPYNSGICRENCDLIWDSPWQAKNAVILPPAARPGMWAVKLWMGGPL